MWFMVRTALVVAVALVSVAGCDGEPHEERAAYVARADAVCERGRDRMRSESEAANSTEVAEQMREELRALGPPPMALTALTPDVAEFLAVVTWAAESFQLAGRDVDDVHVTPEDLRALGFEVCGTP
jgi:hypothetical protein